MAYATQVDIIALYGETALYIADRDGDGVLDADAIERVLASATAEIDSYLAVRHALPLPEVPELLRQLAVDIGLYRLAVWRDALSEDIRQRFEDAIATCKRIADGKQALVLTAAPQEEGEPEAAGPRPIISGGTPRLFDRVSMRDL